MICCRRRNMERATREQSPRWCGRRRSDGMFNVNGEIRVIDIAVLHGRFRGYRCHVADFISDSAILRGRYS